MTVWDTDLSSQPPQTLRMGVVMLVQTMAMLQYNSPLQNRDPCDCQHHTVFYIHKHPKRLFLVGLVLPQPPIKFQIEFEVSLCNPNFKLTFLAHISDKVQA